VYNNLSQRKEKTMTTNETTNQETRKECEANIAYFRAMLQSLNLNRHHPACQEEEYKANHAYYNAELKVWKERLEKINSVTA